MDSSWRCRGTTRGTSWSASADSAGGASAIITRPNGDPQRVTIDPDAREVVVTDTSRQGLYHVAVGTNRVSFVANLMDGNESNIRPRDEIAVGKYAAVQAASVRQANAELWRWLALAGLLVLLFEWWYYHRRSV